MKPTVLITGCGYKPIGYVYKHKGRPTYNGIPIDGIEHKMNIGTAVACFLAKKGVEVIIVSRTLEKLEKIKDGLTQLGCSQDLISVIAADITTEAGIDDIIKKLPKDKSIFWVQSIGMGGGAYAVPNDNIYLPFEQIKPELIAAEMDIVTATHRMMLKMVPIFRKQIKDDQPAKICMITSMSGERGYCFGATHVAAKHALVGYIKGIQTELEQEDIKIYDVRPGCIDTGMYDNSFVRESVGEIVRRSKMYPSFNNNVFIPAQPMEVAEKVYQTLFGMWPNKIYRILGPGQK